MARTPSRMTALGAPAPDFALPDAVSGRTITRDTAAGPHGLLVMFICNHCPFVKHIRSELTRIGNDAKSLGVGVIAISSNDAAAYPDDAPDKMRSEAASAGYTFPYCYDESQHVAHAYDAACTPDFFLYDKSMRLVYRGQLDDSRPGNNIPLTGEDLRTALQSLAANKPISTTQKPSIGCNIKWRPGNEPTHNT